MSLKIGIYLSDYRPDAGGASSLVKTIQKEILNSKSKNEFLFLYKGSIKNNYCSEKNNFKYYNLNSSDLLAKPSFSTKCRNRLKKILNKKINITSSFDLIAEKEEIDIFYFINPVIENVSYPYIYTVWDLGHRTTPYFPEVSRTGWNWNAREEMYQKMVYKASYILTGNEEGKKEILENYPMNPNKIKICPFPVASFCKGEEEKPSFEIPEQYFFYPAQFWPHKNQICIINALHILKETKGLTPKVFLTGADKGNKEYIQSKIIEYGLTKQVTFTGFVKDEELKYLYTHATGMIFASLMGPNNMPPIEATYLNCPVIITDLDGHKEQLKDSALFFNGYKPEELAEQMFKLLSDNSIREKIILKEKKLAKTFEDINYFDNINNLLYNFETIRNTWGKNYLND